MASRTESPGESGDHVDTIIEQWNAERPTVDVSAMAVIGRLSRLDKLVRPRLNAVFAEHDLEPWEFDVLATLLRTGGDHQLTPGHLLESMMITSGAMTNRLDRLEERGFVRRTKSPTDGRQVLVKLTAKGTRKVDAALVDHAVNERSILRGLTAEDEASLVDLLRRLERSISDDGPGST